jgi:hypothetical protein
MSDEWGHVFKWDDPLPVKRAGIERIHRATLEAKFQEWIDDGIFPARLLEPLLEKAMALVQPMVDEDLARLVGRDKLN